MIAGHKSIPAHFIPRLRRRWRYWTTPRALILMYHRITRLPNDPHLLAVTPEHFAEHLDIIRQMGHPISLSDLAQAIQKGRVPNRAIAVTFDDGYADNLHEAKPLLDAAGVPVTVFVTAGQVGSPQEFWWDELDRIFLQPGTLPTSLQLTIQNTWFAWDLGASATYTPADHLCDRAWHLESPTDPTPRHQLFKALFERLLPLAVHERQACLQAVRQWAGLDTPGRATHRALTTSELRELQQGGLVEIGAHTFTHPTLASLSPADQQVEIRQSKQILESCLGQRVTSFAFPSGSYNPETLQILQEEEFGCACNSQTAPVWPGTDRFQMPRLGVRDMKVAAFVRWLNWWLNG
jgi:peptidoglycan/xylan/chitin deacetylase (PgdA/CDA1 family)